MIVTAYRRRTPTSWHIVFRRLIGAFAWWLLVVIGPWGESEVAFAQTVPPVVPPTSLVRVDGAFSTVPIDIDGTTLFRVAAPLQPSAGQIPIAARAAAIEASLAEVLVATGRGSQAATAYEPETLRVHIHREGELASLDVVDADHADPLPILTVTTVDAQYNATTVGVLATQWQSVLQGALVHALLIRQPAVQRAALNLLARLGALLVLGIVVVAALVAALQRRVRRLQGALASARAAEAQSGQTANPEGPEAQRDRRAGIARALVSSRIDRRLSIARAAIETLTWGTVLVAVGTVTWALSLFPQTAALAADLIRSGVGVVAVVVAAIVLNRVADIVIARAADVWRAGATGTSEIRARHLLRIPTIATALAQFKAFVITFVAVLAVLGEVGVPIGSVVTVGGLAAIALSLAAQNFVRDFLNGFLVIFEDQYVVGDYVTINAYSGSVEALSPRMVQIRDASGSLVTVPHSVVTSVVNQSRDWSRIDYRVAFDAATDGAAVVALVRSAIEAVITQRQDGDDAGSAIEWIGIDALGRDGTVVRASIRTAPLRQFELKRAINARVHADALAAGRLFGLAPP